MNAFAPVKLHLHPHVEIVLHFRLVGAACAATIIVRTMQESRISEVVRLRQCLENLFILLLSLVASHAYNECVLDYAFG